MLKCDPSGKYKKCVRSYVQSLEKRQAIDCKLYFRLYPRETTTCIYGYPKIDKWMCDGFTGCDSHLATSENIFLSSGLRIYGYTHITTLNMHWRNVEKGRRNNLREKVCSVCKNHVVILYVAEVSEKFRRVFSKQNPCFF